MAFGSGSSLGPCRGVEGTGAPLREEPHGHVHAGAQHGLNSFPSCRLPRETDKPAVPLTRHMGGTQGRQWEGPPEPCGPRDRPHQEAARLDFGLAPLPGRDPGQTVLGVASQGAFPTDRHGCR